MANTTTNERKLSPKAQELLEAALALSRPEREWILDQLLASVDDGDLDELSADQLAMLRRRSQEVRDGKVTPIPADEALRMLRERRQS